MLFRSLTTWATAPVPFPPNDTCASPRVLDFTGTSSARFIVDTSEAENDTKGTCSTTSGRGRETVYSFTLTSTRTATITSESADGGDAVDPVIYLRKGGCFADAGEVSCVDDYLQPEVMINTLGPGQYFLFVDSYSSSSAGPTLVTVTLSP